jgi:hypothetical protein
MANSSAAGMSKSSVVNQISTIEAHHITEMTHDLNRKLHESRRRDESGRSGVSGVTLGLVVAESYDNAIQEIEMYIDSKWAYPGFQERARRHLRHCVDLIRAIEAKRGFPGLATLSLSKQQEIHEKVLEHFEELKANLRQLEGMERDQKVTDVRSTVWVVRAFAWVMGGVFTTALILDLWSGLLSSTITVGSELLDSTTTWMISLLPF